MRFILLCLLSGVCPCLFAQKKIVILGSSTSAGTGASNYTNSYAGKLTAWFNQNPGDGLDTTVYNLAVGGFTSYQVMQNGYPTPPGRPAVVTANNITKALTYSPDVILINLPSNDMANGYTKTELMNNLRSLYSQATSAGVRCFITTTQPRNLTTVWRDSLKTLVDSINNNFGIYSIDFWTDIVRTDGSNQLKTEVNSGDGIHVNDLGHNYLFEQVRAKSLFSSGILLPLGLKWFTVSLAGNHTVLLRWQTENEDPNTRFYPERSADGISFSPLTSVNGGGGNNNTYSWNDLAAYPGKSFYRLRIAEDARTRYSRIEAVYLKPAGLQISRVIRTASALQVSLVAEHPGVWLCTITGMQGLILYREYKNISAPAANIELPLENLSHGIYILTIQGTGEAVTYRFVY